MGIRPLHFADGESAGCGERAYVVTVSHSDESTASDGRAKPEVRGSQHFPHLAITKPTKWQAARVLSPWRSLFLGLEIF
jgi:hypothetical protein